MSVQVFSSRRQSNCKITADKTYSDTVKMTVHSNRTIQVAGYTQIIELTSYSSAAKCRIIGIGA